VPDVGDGRDLTPAPVLRLARGLLDPQDARLLAAIVPSDDLRLDVRIVTRGRHAEVALEGAHLVLEARLRVPEIMEAPAPRLGAVGHDEVNGPHIERVVRGLLGRCGRLDAPLDDVLPRISTPCFSTAATARPTVARRRSTRSFTSRRAKSSPSSTK